MAYQKSRSIFSNFPLWGAHVDAVNLSAGKGIAALIVFVGPLLMLLNIRPQWGCVGRCFVVYLFSAHRAYSFFPPPAA